MSTAMPTPNERIGATAPLKFKYFDLQFRGGVSGRGGAVRFFFLLAGVEFVEDVVQFSTWKDVKHKFMANGQTRQGYLPVVTLNGMDLTECHAIMRRFSKQLGCNPITILGRLALGLYGDDVDRDYLIDSLADATVSWRWHWASGANGGDAARDKYLTTERAGHYAAFEGFLCERGASGPFTVSGGKLSFADALVFSQLWDDCANFGTDELNKHARLLAFSKAFIAQRPVAAWCRRANQALAATINQA